MMKQVALSMILTAAGALGAAVSDKAGFDAFAQINTDLFTSMPETIGNCKVDSPPQPCEKFLAPLSTKQKPIYEHSESKYHLVFDWITGLKGVRITNVTHSQGRLTLHGELSDTLTVAANQPRNHEISFRPVIENGTQFDLTIGITCNNVVPILSTPVFTSFSMDYDLGGPWFNLGRDAINQAIGFTLFNRVTAETTNLLAFVEGKMAEHVSPEIDVCQSEITYP